MKESMRALIAKLEAATEGSRALDDEIARAVFGWAWTPEDGTNHIGVYNWTRSLDAALTLVSEEWFTLDVQQAAHVGYVWWWTLASMTTERTSHGESSAPALSLCIAALKARMAVDTAAAPV